MAEVTKIVEKKFELLLKVMQELSQEDGFAMYGGTAINAFLCDMPRLSTDIDLAYLDHTENRKTAIEKIEQTLKKVGERIAPKGSGYTVVQPAGSGKIFVRDTRKNLEVKVEANLNSRGIIEQEAEIMSLTKSAQKKFGAPAIKMQIVPKGQLYGGKIRAALNRQHPRDLFDVKGLFGNDGYTDEIHKGFLYCLLSGRQALNDLLDPKLRHGELPTDTSDRWASSGAQVHQTQL